MKIVKFNDNAKTQEGYGIYVSKEGEHAQLTGVVYKADGSRDEDAQLVTVPESAIVKNIEVQEKPFNSYTSTKFLRTITRKHLAQLK